MLILEYLFAYEKRFFCMYDMKIENNIDSFRIMYYELDHVF